MKSPVRILIVEPDQFFAHGFMLAITELFIKHRVKVHFTHTLSEKEWADIIFLSAEQDDMQVRYLTRRKGMPSHQYIFLFKEKMATTDKTKYKALDGIFYRNQSLRYITQTIAQMVHKLLYAIRNAKNRSGPDYELTERESEIIYYLATERRPCDISRILSISQKTVSSHKRSVMTKLGLDRASDLNYWLICKKPTSPYEG